MANPTDHRAMYRPKGPVVSQMCDRCPFRPDGSGFAVDHPDYPLILRQVQLGLPFYCHETVVLDPQTTMKNGWPDPPIQDHFKNCLGAVLVKQGKLDPPEPKPPKRRRRKRK